jgi:peptide-methionine (S)-S-oxide reductase
MVLFDRRKTRLVTADNALPGREARPFRIAGIHTVLATPIDGSVPEGYAEAVFALGCFWGGEEIFWQVPGVWTTAVGYAGGITPNPTYEEVCTGRTGHAEVVRVVYDPEKVSYEELLKLFWESHDPTQVMRQGNDIGTQYRSAIYTTSDEQQQAAEASRETYQSILTRAGYDKIATEILPLGDFYYAEDYHQQYLHKIPNGYRCHSATGLPYPG